MWSALAVIILHLRGLSLRCAKITLKTSARPSLPFHLHPAVGQALILPQTYSFLSTGLKCVCGQIMILLHWSAWTFGISGAKEANNVFDMLKFLLGSLASSSRIVYLGDFVGSPSQLKQQTAPSLHAEGTDLFPPRFYVLSHTDISVIQSLLFGQLRQCFLYVTCAPLYLHAGRQCSCGVMRY